jgi:hypothetical protein
MNSKFIAVFFFFLVFLAPCFSQFSEEEQRIIELLYETQEIHTEGGWSILFIKEVNMGVPGGENWLVEWLDRVTILYTVNGDEVNQIGIFPNFDPAEESNFDIMKDIPGTRIGNSGSAIGDYNDDGYDEVFVYGFSGFLWFISIYGYDDTREKVVSYCEIPFGLVDPDKGPAPVEFMTYRGIKGFKMYQDIANGTPAHDPRHKIEGENRSWYFYAWDEGVRKFVELAEIGEDIDYYMFSNYEVEELKRSRELYELQQRHIETAEPETSAADEPSPVEPEGRGMVPVTAAAAGVVALALAVWGIMLVRRKKRQ